MQICFAGGSQLLSLHRGQNGKWTDIAFDLVVTYCSVHIEVPKRKGAYIAERGTAYSLQEKQSRETRLPS